MEDPDRGPIVVLRHVLWIEILTLISYALLCLLCLLLVIYLRVNRREALKGDPHALRKVILPAFEPLLWVLAICTGIYVLYFSVTIHIDLYTIGFPNLDRECFYCGRMFVFVLVLVFLGQKSVSLSALRTAVIKSLFISLYTLPVVALFTWYAPDQLLLLFFVKLAARPLLLVFVVYVCMVHPPVGRANRCVLRTHGWFIVGYHVISAAYTLSQVYMEDSMVFIILGYLILVWSSMCPLMIWKILRADTEYWRGMGKRVCSLQDVVHHYQPNPHLQGGATVPEDISSHGIHVLIETHREFLIDFAHLELKRKMSSGRRSAMFSGMLRSTKSVAVKVYTPPHFTEEVVGEFSHEAALHASLSHPNIVVFFGMCVCPPTVCLVTELCQYVLEDVLSMRGKSRKHRHSTWFSQTNENDHNNIQRMHVNVAYMLDCSRAVAYLHSFSPPLLHRDIKPANVLLDHDNTLKLTGFSDSRRLPSEIQETTSNMTVLVQPKMTVTGTVDYMAPEMIASRTGLAAYAEAADVYSLAITFWDMLYPHREKYPDTSNNHLLVFQGVLSGARPSINEDETTDEAIPPRLLNLITSSWGDDPSTRPPAQQLVKELEEIQEELLAVLARGLLNDFDSPNSGNLEPSVSVFTGEYAVDRMEELTVIESRREGVRLGRALMDAGFLHHIEHTCSFQDSETNLYFLDDDNISFCQPLAILEESANASQDSEGGHSTEQNFQQVANSTKPNLRKRSRLLSHLTSTFSGNGPTVSDVGGGSRCSCRLLGQLRDTIPASSRFRRHRRQMAINRSSNSMCSNDSASTMAPTPRRWHLGRKTGSENSLRNKLLDEDEYIVDIEQEV